MGAVVMGGGFQMSAGMGRVECGGVTRLAVLRPEELGLLSGGI